MADEIAFFLRGRPFGGGVNSVVQEFSALVRNFGVGRLVVEERHLEDFRRGYTWPADGLNRLSSSLSDLPAGSAVVATTNDSLGQLIGDVKEQAARVYYYVQDYEPLFYGLHTQQHLVALESYMLAHEAVAVVKTGWLARTLLSATFFPVVQIRPSIDRSIYHPILRQADDPRRLVAMLRPSTSRRGAHRTAAVLNRLASCPAVDLQIDVFGTAAADLRLAGLHLDPQIRNHGRLSSQVAGELVRSSDFLLDLSDYQAFGRSVAEGMAAGVVPVVTDRGAPPDFVSDGLNGHLVPPQDLDRAYMRLADLAALPEDALRAMRGAAYEAVCGWSLDNTAADWFALMRDA